MLQLSKLKKMGSLIIRFVGVKEKREIKKLSSREDYVRIQLDAEKEIIVDVSEWVGEEKEWEYWSEYVKDYMYRGCKWLEIGCNTGYVIRFIDSKYNSIGHGIDINSNLINIGKRQCGTETLIQGDMHDLPYNDEFFDFLWAKDVLEHSYDPDLLLSECHRVLKKGSYMFAFLPLDGKEEETIGEIYGNEAHTWNTTSDVCKERFENAGFEIIRFSETTFSELRGEYRHLGDNCLSLIVLKY